MCSLDVMIPLLCLAVSGVLLLPRDAPLVRARPSPVVRSSTPRCALFKQRPLTDGSEWDGLVSKITECASRDQTQVTAASLPTLAREPIVAGMVPLSRWATSTTRG